MVEGMVLIISGPSGSGKGTVVKQLDPVKGYARSISVTTRKPREGEVDGRDYFFTTEDAFIHMRNNRELLEHAVYVGNYYGTPKAYVEDQIKLGKVVVLEIEVYGAVQVKEMMPDAVLIFLIPPSITELESRLVNRNTEDALTISSRLKKAQEELPFVAQYDYLVVNDKVDHAVSLIDCIVEAERLKPKRNQQTLINFSQKEGVFNA